MKIIYMEVIIAMSVIVHVFVNTVESQFFLTTLGKQISSNYWKVWKIGSKITVLTGEGKLVWFELSGISKNRRFKKWGLYCDALLQTSW